MATTMKSLNTSSDTNHAIKSAVWTLRQCSTFELAQRARATPTSIPSYPPVRDLVLPVLPARHKEAVNNQDDR
ncbi:hypothetical protein N7535_002797 [Penicillium sp. DV-2018c]|nr:hypothetical protein N7461_001521 [Penicillium sp. DV-2018c]KAJ5575871.1 hypothetical protein N7535_002797 [Penicillium sp. DV-2018c]